MTQVVDSSPGLHLFEGFGVELEYMLINAEDGRVAPISDRLIQAASGGIEAEIEMGELAWSNEIVLHVIELKTNGPAPSLSPLAGLFARDIARIGALLAPLGAALLPTAMHPTMDPARETRLWPHDYGEVYRIFDRIFDCKGHGWSNLQSAHLNLPYQGDDEFGRLHAAIRVLLPLLPALSASSPVFDGRLTGVMDNRLELYRENCARLPVVTGQVIPEPVFTLADYDREILEPIRRAVAPFDPDEELDAEWVNARGAIARPCRDSIEIRVLDVQEHPGMDLAIIAATVAALRALVEERWSSGAVQRGADTQCLARVFRECLRGGSRAIVDEPAVLKPLGLNKPMQARDLWRSLIQRCLDDGLLEARGEWTDALDVITSQGTLAERIVAALGAAPPPDRIDEVYADLRSCLMAGRSFAGTAP